MLVTHELTVHATCPVNGAADEYAVTVEVYRVLKVEDIDAAVAKLAAGGPILQEEWTERLAKGLFARVVTRCRRDKITTTVECGV